MEVSFSKIIIALVTVICFAQIFSPIGWDYLLDKNGKVTKVCTETNYLYDYYANSRTPYKHKFCSRKSLIAAR